jgi:hypothetical protein
MEIELKKIYVNQRLSRETTLFQADLYINGVKAGFAENDGQGGATNYRWLTQEGRALIKAAEEYLEKQPPKIERYDDEGMEKTYEVKQSLDQKIDDMVADYVFAKAQKANEDRFDKQMAKDMEKGIVYGIPGERKYTVQHFRVPIEKILETPKYRAALKTFFTNTLLPKLGKDLKILNTNIHPDDLQMLGVPLKYTIAAKPGVKRKPTGPRAKWNDARKQGGPKK